MEFLDGIINMRLKPSDKEKLIQKAKEKHEEFLAKKEYDSQGITDEDIENETDDYLMA